MKPFFELLEVFGSLAFALQGLKSSTRVKMSIVSCPPVTTVLIRRPDQRYQLGFSVQNGIVCNIEASSFCLQFHSIWCCYMTTPKVDYTFLKVCISVHRLVLFIRFYWYYFTFKKTPCHSVQTRNNNKSKVLVSCLSHLHLVHSADAFIQSDYNKYICQKQLYISTYMLVQ